MKVLAIDIPTVPVRMTPAAQEYMHTLCQFEMAVKQEKLGRLKGVRFPPARTFSIGLLSICTVLRELGAEVRFVNGDSDSDLLNRSKVLGRDADLVLASCKTATYLQVLHVVQAVKATNPRANKMKTAPATAGKKASTN